MRSISTIQVPEGTNRTYAVTLSLDKALKLRKQILVRANRGRRVFQNQIFFSRFLKMTKFPHLSLDLLQSVELRNEIEHFFKQASVEGGEQTLNESLEHVANFLVPTERHEDLPSSFIDFASFLFNQLEEFIESNELSSMSSRTVNWFYVLWFLSKSVPVYSFFTLPGDYGACSKERLKAIVGLIKKPNIKYLFDDWSMSFYNVQIFQFLVERVK